MRKSVSVSEGRTTACRQRLARYKIPQLVEFRTELPKTMIGKVLRRVLAEEEKAKRAGQSKEGHAPSR